MSPTSSIADSATDTTTPTSRPARLVALWAGLLCLTAGCASLQLAEEAPDLPPRANLEAVPFHPQTEFHCGPAALATVLEHSGQAVSVEQLADRVYTPGLKGSLQAEMVATARSHGRLVYRLPPEPGALLAEVASGRPVLVLENPGLESRPYWHYAVIVGYDQGDNVLLLRSGEAREQRIGAGRWLRRWDRAGRWAVILLEPGQWPASPQREAWLAAAADFEAQAHVEDARAVWQQTLQRWPDAPLAWLGLGNVEFARGDVAAAITAYQAVIEHAPDHAAGRFNLAVALEHDGQHCAAARLLDSLGDHATLAGQATERRMRLPADCQSAEP